MLLKCQLLLIESQYIFALFKGVNNIKMSAIADSYWYPMLTIFDANVIKMSAIAD